MLPLWILVGLVFFAGLSLEQKLARANRIARATHDLIKEMLAEQLKANDWLEKIAARTGRIAPPPVPAETKKNAGDTPAATGAEVYRL